MVTGEKATDEKYLNSKTDSRAHIKVYSMSTESSVYTKYYYFQSEVLMMGH